MMQAHRKPCHWKVFRHSCVQSKAVLLLLLWTVLHPCSHRIVFHMTYNLIGTRMDKIINVIVDHLYILLYLAYPVIGWMADTWLGRYRLLTTSLYINIFGPLLVAIAYCITSVLPTDPTASFVSTALLYCGMLVTVIAISTFIATMLPYIIDQLVGAPAEELSAAVFWWYWTTTLGKDTMLFLLDIYPDHLFWTITVLVSVTIPVVTHLLLKQWLVKIPILANPIKQIAKVLNYARKNKYPRNRSALTYWEDEYPSRVDLGKDKYGGPFTEEEVEDVKTVLRLLPLLIPMTISGLVQASHWPAHYSPTTVNIINTAMNNSGFPLLVLALIPLWQLLVYPFLYSYIPSILKRIGTGLFLLILATCTYTTLELIGHSVNQNVGCYLDNSTTNIVNISVAWLIFPQILQTIGKFVLTVASLEFIVAQAPIQVRAIMIGLWFAMNGLTALLGFNLHYAIKRIPSSSFPSCGFYLFLSNTVIIVVVFVLFVFLSKRYRLRERNIPVNYHLFAENYYDKYINIARELEREGLGEEEIAAQ